MRRTARRAGLLLIALLIAAQLIRIERTNPRVGPPVGRELVAPAEVHALLRRACYDCHSNETRWPWYARVAPASWLVAHDVDEGREELNFSTWEAYPPARRRKLLRETAEEVAEGKMPPWYYVLLHDEARLGPAERDALRAWTAAELARAAAPAAP
jgi:hypothetical protein